MRYRTIFISDLHLGTRRCQAAKMLEFLRSIEAEAIYLVGDIVDEWQFKRGAHWPEAHSEIEDILSSDSVIRLPGNHDDSLRSHLPDTAVHIAADGKRYLVIHGDQFDIASQRARPFAFMGDWAHVAIKSLLYIPNAIRTWLDLPVWRRPSIGMLFRNYHNWFEATLAAHAKAQGFDGIICGHSHKPALKNVGGVAYINCGDWIDNCTAIVEHDDGRFSIVK